MSTTSPKLRASCSSAGWTARSGTSPTTSPSRRRDVIAYAAALLGVEPPPEEPFEPANLSPMSASFFAEEKRVSNAKAKRLLGFSPAYPSYREGLRALAEAGEGR